MVEKHTYKYPLLADNALENAFAKAKSSFIPEIVDITERLKENKLDFTALYERISPLLPVFLLFYYRKWGTFI